MAMKLETDGLCIRIGERTLVEDLDLALDAGSLVCVLGTNGVGKTLTLHTLAGLRAPAAGSVRIGGDVLTSLPRRQVARRLGLLLQIHEDAFPVTVLDSVMMGLYPRLGFWQWTNADDRQTALDALRAFDLEGLESRLVSTLSGGERERVALATLHVQDPPVWLLDEPMNHLDPHHQLDVFAHLRDQASRGRIVMATVHSPQLAMRYADDVLLLYGDGAWEFGPAEQLLEPGRLERVYRTRFEYYAAEDTGQGSLKRVLLPTA